MAEEQAKLPSVLININIQKGLDFERMLGVLLISRALVT
jgi:hypothetical protein